MDYKDLINRLKNETYWLGSGEPYSRDVHPIICDEASTAIEELVERAEKAEKIVDKYAESARAIALWLSAYCDKTLSYPSMISNAARKISVAYADIEKRAEKAEKERDDYKELFFAYKHVCCGVSPDRIGELVEADKAGRCYITTVKIGERVFLPNEKGEIIECRVQGIFLPAHGKNLIIHLGGCPAEYLWADREGVDWWKTRESAEGVLKGEENGKEKSEKDLL